MLSGGAAWPTPCAACSASRRQKMAGPGVHVDKMQHSVHGHQASARRMNAADQRQLLCCDIRSPCPHSRLGSPPWQTKSRQGEDVRCYDLWLPMAVSNSVKCCSILLMTLPVDGCVPEIRSVDGSFMRAVLAGCCVVCTYRWWKWSWNCRPPWQVSYTCRYKFLRVPA